MKKHNVTCGNCGTRYSRPKKQDEIKSGFPNCPNCAAPGPAYHLNNGMQMKKLSAIDLIKIAMED